MEFKKTLTEFVRAAMMEAAANGNTLVSDLSLLVLGGPMAGTEIKFGFGEHDYRLVAYTKTSDGTTEMLSLDDAVERFAAAAFGKEYQPPPPVQRTHPIPGAGVVRRPAGVMPPGYTFPRRLGPRQPPRTP